MILRITMGLPGSGKTHWSTEETKKSRRYDRRNMRIDFDNFTKRKIDEKRISQEISGCIRYSYNEQTIIDGLFLTYADIEKLLSMLDPADWTYVKELTLEWWRPDIEMCLINDKGRRSENASITIKNAKLEEVDSEFIAKLEEKFPKLKGKVKLNKHSIVMKPKWKAFAEEHELYIDDSGKVRGDSWCLGGSWGDCWGNHGSVSGEAPPDSFREFDAILEKVAPNISFLQYKRIYSECVQTDDYSDGDYYGGSTSHAYRYFYVEQLYNALKERELI